MNKEITVALVSHTVQDDNLGCCALAIAHIGMLDKVFARMGIPVKYVIAATDNLEQPALESYTWNPYEYRLYPRCRQSLKNPLRLLGTKVFQGCDLVFNLCGGDGYADIYGFGRLLAESQLAWVARMHRIPVIYAPQTIGPFQSPAGRLVARATLGGVKRVFVRDHASWECCESLGLIGHTTEVMDVAFALPYEKQSRGEEKISVGVNVSGLLYNGGFDGKNYFGLAFSYKDFVHLLLRRLCGDGRYQVHLIPHVNAQNKPVDDDWRVCQSLAAQYGCLLAPCFTSPIDAKSYISGMDVFTGARMHATIAAISSGVSVIPVAYSRKFNGLYGSLDYPWLIDAKAEGTAEKAVEAFMRMLDQPGQMRRDVEKAKSIYQKKLREYESCLQQVIAAALAEKGPREGSKQ